MFIYQEMCLPKRWMLDCLSFLTFFQMMGTRASNILSRASRRFWKRKEKAAVLIKNCHEGIYCLLSILAPSLQYHRLCLIIDFLSNGVLAICNFWLIWGEFSASEQRLSFSLTSLMIMVPSMASLRSCRVCRTRDMTRCILSTS